MAPSARAHPLPAVYVLFDPSLPSMVEEVRCAMEECQARVGNSGRTGEVEAMACPAGRP